MLRVLILITVFLSAGSANSQSNATHTVEVLDLQVAMKAALRALVVCNEAGHQVGASVVDRFGLEQVTLRSNLGGAHVADTARRKAWTAATFNLSTLELDKVAESGEPWGLRTIPGVVPLGGGLPIRSKSGQLLGGIGVAGGGGGENEAKCAQAGLDAIADQLE
ncbi:MAG: heme-binding protein [Roseibium sp.]|uniref:GlcG/HbpS family heme-binding protein n=1 Tax=Roseibium sp. TaxID=1936156 RepID=UPI00261C1225|nr:heme-binding protein [Roseibium sp.]MCV0429005.1 heme-binding protein [Roseibium sp.]